MAQTKYTLIQYRHSANEAMDMPHWDTWPDSSEGSGHLSEVSSNDAVHAEGGQPSQPAEHLAEARAQPSQPPKKKTKKKKKGRSRGARLTKQKHLAEARRDVALSGPSLDCNAVGVACEATLAIDYVKRARSSSARNQRKKFAKQVEATGGAHAKSKAKKTHDKAVVGEMPIEE